MKWSWKIGEYSGIGVYIHATFLLIVGWVIWQHWSMGHNLMTTLGGLAFTMAIFVCVLLHEFGHALTAKKMGIRTRDITLYPIGGVARLERMPEDPRQELWVALAGPAVNVGIALVLLVVLVISNTLEPWQNLSVTNGNFLERLLAVNVMLVLFNLLPAFPMDGGRVLRALLATRKPYAQATQIAASIGQGMAFLFGILGLLGNPFLLFIAFFIYIGASQEASLAQMKSALGGIPIERAMITNFETLNAGESLNRAVELIIKGSQQDFPVLENGRVAGILTRADLLLALAQKGQETPVVEVMKREFLPIHPGEMFDVVFQRLQECQCHTIPVVQRERLVGLVTMDNLGEFLLIQSALSAKNPSSGGEIKWAYQSRT